MTRACASCEWARDQSRFRATCREGPVPVPVHLDHWCGRYRRSEASIRSGNPGAEEILKHFDKEGRA